MSEDILRLTSDLYTFVREVESAIHDLSLSYNSTSFTARLKT